MRSGKFIESYFKAWNEQDSGAIANHLSDGGSYLDVPYQSRLTPTELVQDLNEVFESESNTYELAGPILATENTIAFQYAVTPRNHYNDGTNAEKWYGAEFMTVRAGSATEIVDYYQLKNEDAVDSPIELSHDMKRYAKSGLGALQIEAYKQKLEAIMDHERIYLDSNLTLPILASHMGCSVNHLSQVINVGFGVSFFDYVNGLRIKESIKLLCQNKDLAPNVLGVALEVGFNSTSTFYLAFRKVTGQTPAAYRRTNCTSNS